MKQLILTVGLPCSGKSTWARSQPHPVVSSDAIRKAFFGISWSEAREHLILPMAKTFVCALFCAGHGTVLFDSVNITRKLRSFWKPSPDLLWSRTYQVFPTSARMCKERAMTLGKLHLIPVIDNMDSDYEPVELDESGYESVSGRNEQDFV